MALDLVPFPFESDDVTPGARPLHGRCMPWCNQTEQKKAAPVAEHTQWCESIGYGGVKAHDTYGERHEVWFSRIGPYLHGTYAEDLDLRLAYEKDICITTANCESDVEEQRLYISSAEARQLAAALLFLADNAEMLDRPLNGGQ